MSPSTPRRARSEEPLSGAFSGARRLRSKAPLSAAAAGGASLCHRAGAIAVPSVPSLNSYPVADSGVTAERIGYAPSQGTVAKIEDFYLDPEGVAPGGKVKLNGSYYVMAPEGNREMKVTETRTVHYFDPSENQWKELGAVEWGCYGGARDEEG
ncbi:MAG: hypothetical protein MZV70_13400 [Desulfobacterales bacterium]|nr:hypothetical protein [Desulfobacterales bacterium]